MNSEIRDYCFNLIINSELTEWSNDKLINNNIVIYIKNDENFQVEIYDSNCNGRPQCGFWLTYQKIHIILKVKNINMFLLIN